MGRRHDLPDALERRFGGGFSVEQARLHGVSRGRLRGPDLQRPFYGVRVLGDADAVTQQRDDPYARQRQARIARARLYAPRLHTGHHFSHHTAVSIWGGPLPLQYDFDERTGIESVADDDALDLHVSAIGPVAFPRTAGIVGHRTLQSMTEVGEHDGLRVSMPAATWAAMGTLRLFDLVALGDYFCRVWRDGRGRPTPGRTPLATIADLRVALESGRRRGAERLRAALEAVREDSWSPRESRARCILISAGLPEPELNVDVFDDDGLFLGCVDMVYRNQRVIIEYLGMLHGEQWARDVERIAALRAAGWTVIEVTAPLLRDEVEFVRRVRAALR